MSEHLITPEEMAGRLGIPESTVMGWNKAKGWPHVRVARRIRWTEEQYAEIVRGLSITPAKAKKLPGQTGLSARRSA